ncbi:MAG: FAD-dependent oxidoreductase [Acidimicrobiales bacterium]
MSGASAVSSANWHASWSIPGVELPGVSDFKSLRTADGLVGRVRRGEATSALIVGDGFIGIGLSLLLSDLGVDVTIISRRGWVMPRVLDPITSTVAEDALKRRGVTLRLGGAGRCVRREPLGHRGPAGRRRDPLGGPHGGDHGSQAPH